jgi:hypothetical protein
MGEQHANGWRVSRHRLVADATVERSRGSTRPQGMIW